MAATEYYNPSGWPATGSSGSSAAARSEANLISAGFGKLPDLSGNGNQFVVINSGGSAMIPVAASAARALIGLEIGTDVQAQNARLTDISGLAVTDGAMIVGDGANFVLESGSTLRASIGVAIGSNVQAWSTHLDAIAALSKTDGNFIVANGTTFVAESDSTARTSLGLGSIATRNLTISTSGPSGGSNGDLWFQRAS